MSIQYTVMGKIFDTIIEFFKNKAVSMPKKLAIIVLLVFSVFLVDNYCGFSYYFVQSYKLNYITSLEDARVKYAKDRVVSQELDRMMVNALNRWTIFNAVADIFQKTFSTTSDAREQQLTNEIVKEQKKIVVKETQKKVEIKENSNNILSFLFPVAERSPFWHTVCSCFNLILCLLLCVFYLVYSPFIHDKSKKNAVLGMCILIPLLVGMIFFVQWIFSEIPDIDGRPRINNIIYMIVNILILILIGKKTVKN